MGGDCFEQDVVACGVGGLEGLRDVGLELAGFEEVGHEGRGQLAWGAAGAGGAAVSFVLAWGSWLGKVL